MATGIAAARARLKRAYEAPESGDGARDTEHNEAVVLRNVILGCAAD